VNSNWHHYYFGDYHDAAYVRKGYTPWVDHHITRNIPDPLFSYYRWEHRKDNRWENDLRATYKGRREGIVQRPPRTLVQQHKQVTQLREKAIQPVVHLKQWKGTNFKLERVPKEHVEALHKSVNQWREFSNQRGKIESQARKVVTPGKQPAVVHQSVRIQMPRTEVRAPAVIRKPPPHPAIPKPQHRDKGKGKG